jgi:uncharacterized protein (TIGR02145 family)
MMDFAHAHFAPPDIREGNGGRIQINSMKHIMIILLLHVGILTTAQQVTNIHFEQDGQMINIYYDLNGVGTYEIKVFCSQDGGATWGEPLKHVSGDVGESQKAGKAKKIIWNVLSERESVQGEIVIKVEILSNEMIDDFTGNKGLFTDTRDGKIYKWVKIGTQVWMAQNLDYGRFVHTKEKQLDNNVVEKYCYENNEHICKLNGGLYQLYEAIYYDDRQSTDICPEGWHLPSIDEWDLFINQLKGEIRKEINIKSVSYVNFDEDDYYLQMSDFNPTYGGFWSNNTKKFAELDFMAFLRSSEDVHYQLYKPKMIIRKVPKNPKSAFSVRCIKD